MGCKHGVEGACTRCGDEDLRLQVKRLRGDLERIATFARNSVATAHFDMADWRSDMQAVANEAKRALDA